MLSLRFVVWGALGATASIVAACVGGDDNVNPVDGGNDATIDQQTTDQQSSDAATSTCGVCDGSCYDDVCNGATVIGTAMGWYFACALLTDQTVWCWGQNDYGQVKNPPSGAFLPPTQIQGLSNVTGIIAGASHMCAMESDASVWCWGINDYGELGHPPTQGGDLSCLNNTPCNPVPSKVSGIPAKVLSAGRWNSCAITTTNGLICWGYNGTGQLGQGGAPSDGTATPTAVPGLSNIVTLRMSKFPGDNVCVIDNKGALYCWGSNAFGQLGDGTRTGPETTCYEPSGSPNIPCNTTPTKVSTPGGLNAVDVAISSSTCVALSDGSVWCWGDGRGGEMGNGAIPDGGSQLTAIQVPNVAGATNIEGNQTLCATLDAGSISCWGVARWGVPGGYGVDAGCFDQGGTATTCQLSPTLIPNLTPSGFPRVSFHSAIVNTAAGPLAWGDNEALELGHPRDAGDTANETNSTPSPVQGLP